MAKVIHDLTVGRDFDSSRGFDFRLPMFEMPSDDYSDFKNELVLTGDWMQRDSKRFVKDFEGEGNICDCCGSFVRIKPWDFKKVGKLCDTCEKMMKHMHSEEFSGYPDVVVGTTDTDFILNSIKPWNFKEDREEPINNVLLWD